MPTHSQNECGKVTENGPFFSMKNSPEKSILFAFNSFNSSNHPIQSVVIFRPSETGYALTGIGRDHLIGECCEHSIPGAISGSEPLDSSSKLCKGAGEPWPQCYGRCQSTDQKLQVTQLHGGSHRSAIRSHQNM